jgi:hypothetical protein
MAAFDLKQKTRQSAGFFWTLFTEHFAGWLLPLDTAEGWEGVDLRMH